MKTQLKNEKQICEYYISEINRAIKESKSNSERALGGLLRSIKGTLVADITEALVRIAWVENGGKPDKIEFKQTRQILLVEKEYISRQKEPAVKELLLNNRDQGYGYSVDKHIFIDSKLVLAIECKAYTENAMLKRILFDFYLLKKSYPKMNCALVQLENMLGGDYGNGSKIQAGSISSHSLMAQFDFNLNIITLLEGDRKVDEPVHNLKYLKVLNPKLVRIAIDKIKLLLPNG